MKKMKKILAMLLAMAMVMVMGMCMTVFATEDITPPTESTEESGEDGQNTPPESNPEDTTEGATGAKPTASDKALASVKNINQTGVTVTAYQVVKAEYNANGFTGYSWVEGTGYNSGETKRELFIDIKTGETTTKTLNIDEAAIVALAGKAKENALGNGIQMTTTGAEGTYSADLPVGSYVVLVTGSDDTIYNPMLVSVYYSVSGNSNQMVAGSLDAESAWTLNAHDGFVKSSEPKVEKTIVNPGSGNDHGDDVAIGDTVSFRIDTQMPSYSDQYTDPKFNISDTISEGLTYKANTLKVYVKTETMDGEETLTEIPEGSYTVNPAFTPDSKTFKVNFTTDYIKENQNQYIVIQYDAELNEHAGINFDANTNTAKLEYSNNPDPNVDLKEKEDTTYHYTFGIDAALNGSDSEKTQELYKLDENGTAVVEGETVTVTSPLAGAKFELRKVDAEGDVDEAHVYEAVSAADGSLSFTGLDAGKYVLVETEAPKGYSLDPTEHKVEITATYYTAPEENKGKLESYTIKIDNEATSTYKATYESSDGTKVTTIDKTHLGVTGIKNTKLASLPSTGGIGTTIFTIGGCAIMIIAAGLFFATRRKTEK
nr:isopeptide-forming domain-containing fimbrial protein [uncultured Acetatifactor sp.]